MNTKPRKQKYPRINLAFYGVNLDYVREASWQNHMSITEFINRLIEKDRNQQTTVTMSPKTGRWMARVDIPNTLPRYQCSHCGDYVQAGDDRNFCPSCGAKMNT